MEFNPYISLQKISWCDFWSRPKWILRGFLVQVATLTALWALLGLPIKSHPHFCPQTLSQGDGTSPAALPRARFDQQDRAVGKPPGPKEHRAGMLRADITFVAPWTTSLPPASKLGYFYCPKTPHSQQHKVRCRQCSAYETLQENSQQIGRERKMDLSPLMAWLAVGRREGGSFCSGFVPISQTSSMLSHSHSNGATLKSVIGLGREGEGRTLWKDMTWCKTTCEIKQAAGGNRNMGIWQNPAPGMIY